MNTFVQKLESACESHRSLLCVGLDPDPQQMPEKDVFQFNRAIVDATEDLVCAYKPNLAFYEALGLEGLEALQRTVEHIRSRDPQVLIIGDAKRGDIGSSMEAYTRAMFDVWGFDATTMSPYLGSDSMAPPLAHGDRGTFVLCRTSNQGAGDFQDIEAPYQGEDRPLYQHVALKSRQLNTSGNVGLVVGATCPQELKVVRELCPDMPLLIPGIGAQGGDLEEAVREGTDSRGRLAIISSSRQVLYASGGQEFPHAARREASTLRDRINGVLEGQGLGWTS